MYKGLQKRFFLTILLMSACGFVRAGVLRGTVRDAETGESLPGVTVSIAGTGCYALTDMDGIYSIDYGNLKSGVVSVSCFSYCTVTTESLVLPEEGFVRDFGLKPDVVTLGDVVLTGRRNNELETVLLSDRMKAGKAIENIGAGEMNIKGLSNAAEAMGTMTGISFADAGELFVRGLGDRYSLTTLNGLPIASPNPDNKLIPLDIFPSMAIGSVVVNKVYSAESFADYSGARIDIETKENIGSDFLSVSLKGSGNFNTTFGEFYTNTRRGWLLKDNDFDRSVIDMTSSEMSDYMKENDIFRTSFNINRLASALPGAGGTLSAGKSFGLGSGTLNLLASVGIDSDKQTVRNAFVKTVNANGDALSDFGYDSYERNMELAALFSAGYLADKGDKLNYTLFYAKNVNDSYKLRKGYDEEGNHLLGSNSLTHSYEMINNQLYGYHEFGDNWFLDWKMSYGMTESDEPDRRQIMYRIKDDGSLALFNLNRQETMRYFGNLNENEFIGDVSAGYSFGNEDRMHLSFGTAFKYKDRKYYSYRFYYNVKNIDPVIADIYNPDSFLTSEDISSGLIPVMLDAQPKNNYFAGSDVLAGFVEFEYRPIDPLLLSLGARYEYSRQHVTYWLDGAIEKNSSVSRLDGGDVFPAFNVKYDLNDSNILRFSSSVTVTRPLFIEMAPFLYKESYGSAESRGNEDIRNGYNYNFDLKYDFCSGNKRNIASVALYYKILKTPIERIQDSSGGSAVYSFRNAEQGMAAGIEAEYKTIITDALQTGVNVSLMYTDVTLLANGGIYTDSRRALQGASPYLGNAYVTYAPKFENGSSVSFSLRYNLQGPRISTVGIYGLGNEIQKAFHSMDFNAIYNIDKHWGVELSLGNLLNSKLSFEQEVKGKSPVQTSSYEFGRTIGLELKYNF